MILASGEKGIVHFLFGFPFGGVQAERKHGKIVIGECNKFRYYLGLGSGMRIDLLCTSPPKLQLTTSRKAGEGGTGVKIHRILPMAGNHQAAQIGITSARI